MSETGGNEMPPASAASGPVVPVRSCCCTPPQSSRALPPSGGDAEYVRTAEAFFTMEDVFDDTERGRYDVAIFGGIQVDAFGNFNLTRIGAPGGPPRLRGPGFVNAGIATTRVTETRLDREPAAVVDSLRRHLARRAGIK